MPNLYAALITLVSILSLTVSTQTLANAAYKKSAVSNQPPDHYWYEGHRKQALWQASDEVVVHAAPGKGRSVPTLPHIARSLINDATVLYGNQSWVHLKLNTAAITGHALSLSRNQKKSAINLISAVYYTDSNRQTGLHIATGELILHFHPAMSFKQVQHWGQTHNLSLMRPLNLDQAYLFHCNQPENCLSLANQLYQHPQVKYAYPNWIRPKTKRHPDLFTANDTLFDQQWTLDNRGQTDGRIGADLNLLPAWVLGHGSRNEIIAIIDDGVAIAHEDLQDNIVHHLCWDFIDNDNDPTSTDQAHGTWTAGVAAARGGNSLGISGVAPHAGLVGIRLLDGAETVSNQAAALTRNDQSIDIYSNSWGPADDAHLEGLDPLTEAALIEGVNNGRNGKGVLYLWAGGNGQARKDNSNYDGYANSPYTIAVAASTHTGIQAHYSENGANLWVNAPSSNGSVNVITTTLQDSGDTDNHYTSNFGGTSAATPQVAGVIALMLEQNPALGWRDVQRILAETAVQNDPQDSDWVENGVGLPINHKYGFGRVDAEAAVIAARTWTQAPAQVTTEVSKILTGVSIPDNDATGISTTLNIHKNLQIEYVELTFSSDHPYWGDLELILTSPSGTQSILAEPNRNSAGAAYSNGWRFGIARLLGEHSQGQWTLTVKDREAEDSGHINRWSLKVYGTPAPPPPIEFGTASVDHNWQTIKLRSRFADPVVIVSPLTFNGGQPAVMRVQKVENNQFQLRIQEWLYLDQRHVTESVAYLVVEKGRHQLADGSIWEAGTFIQSGTGLWSPLRLDTSAKLFLTLQSFNGGQTVTPRARSESPFHNRSTPLIPDPNNGSRLFYTALFEEEALMDGHKPELVGYLAIRTSTNPSQININGNLTAYTLNRAAFTDSWTPANKDWQLKLEEETSADAETRHLAETLSLLTINGHLFAQDMSSRGGNTIGIRVRPTAQ